MTQLPQPRPRLQRDAKPLPKAHLEETPIEEKSKNVADIDRVVLKRGAPVDFGLI